jgi:hypothetical protein
MVARLLSGSLTGKRLLQLSVQGQRLHIVIEPSLYRLDDGIERALGCQGKPIPDLEAQFSLVAPRYQRTGDVGNVRKQAGCRLSPGKRGGSESAGRVRWHLEPPDRSPPDRGSPDRSRPDRGPPGRGSLGRVRDPGRGMRVRRPGPPDAGPPTPEPLALSLLVLLRWHCSGDAPWRRPTTGSAHCPALASGVLFFGLFLPVSGFIAPTFLSHLSRWIQ